MPPGADNKTCTDNNLTKCEIYEVAVDGACEPKCDVMNGGCADGNDCATDQITGDVDCTCPLGTMPINDGTCAEVCPNPDGFVMNMDTGKCEDIDECAEETDGCEDKCVNEVGSYTCECTEGELSTDGLSCTNVNPCETDNGGCEGGCTHVAHERYECTCDAGYVLAADKLDCESLCDATPNGDCRENSECNLSVAGEVQCPCVPGFTDVAGICTDICETDQNPCEQICSQTGVRAEPIACNCGEGYNMVDGECVDGCEDYGCEGTCVNLQNDLYVCECPLGMGVQLAADGKSCEDIDECQDFNGQCSHTCVNDQPLYHCECPTDMELDVTGKKCTDIDVCETEKPCDHECINVPGAGFKCVCDEGFILAADLTTCIDECNIDNGGCGKFCTHADNGATVCFCNEGFELAPDGKACNDIDECARETDECDLGCENTEGSFVCTCPDGFVLHTDGKQCDDVDPCSINNGGCSHDCVSGNAVDPATCECPDEMFLINDKLTCQHKCDDENNGCEQVCDRQTADCICNEGWTLDVNGKTCSDVNECTEELDDCEQICANELGSFTCGCEKGFMPDTTDPSKCVDIDECANNNGGCKQVCQNLAGTYRCECEDADLCQEGYMHEITTDQCHDVDECATNNGGCQGGPCRNTEGGFICMQPVP